MFFLLVDSGRWRGRGIKIVLWKGEAALSEGNAADKTELQ
jgi:hypothetical protein